MPAGSGTTGLTTASATSHCQLRGHRSVSKAAPSASCGASGLNARHIAWAYYDRPADAWMTDHWERHRPALDERTGTPEHETAY